MKFKFSFFVGVICLLAGIIGTIAFFGLFYKSYDSRVYQVNNALMSYREYPAWIFQLLFFILFVASIYLFIKSIPWIGEGLIFRDKKTLGGKIKLFTLNFLLKSITKHPLVVFIARRILAMIPILLIMTFVVIGLAQLAPGDILTQFRLTPEIKPETLQKLAVQYGLDKPFIRKYLDWLKNFLLHGELGESLAYKRPVMDLIGANLPHTIFLNFVGIIFTYLLAIPLGVLCAVKQFKWQDRVVSFTSFIFLSTPAYFFAILLLLFAYTTKLFPVGAGTPFNWVDMNTVQKMGNYMHRMILPVLATSMAGVASFIRFMRGQMLEELNKLYITTAKSKGLKRTGIIYKHALRNAINPFVTNFAYILAGLLGSSVLVEIIFNFPGIGYIMYQATLSEDIFLVMANFLLTSVLTLVGIIVSDILLTIVDPRIRIS